MDQLLGKTSPFVMVGTSPAVSLREAQPCLMIEIAGTSPAMTKESVSDW
jgi:hypothetical protein